MRVRSAVESYSAFAGMIWSQHRPDHCAQNVWSCEACGSQSEHTVYFCSRRVGDFIGKIAKGYKADLVLLDLDHVDFVPLTTNQIVFTENGGAVDKVLIGGKLVVAGGRAIGIDRAALAAKAQAGRVLPEGIEPIVSDYGRGFVTSLS